MKRKWIEGAEIEWMQVITLMCGYFIVEQNIVSIPLFENGWNEISYTFFISFKYTNINIISYYNLLINIEILNGWPISFHPFVKLKSELLNDNPFKYSKLILYIIHGNDGKLRFSPIHKVENHV